MPDGASDAPSVSDRAGEMMMSATAGGISTRSRSAAPLKSSTYTCRYRGERCEPTPRWPHGGSSPRSWRAVRSATQRVAAGGSGCV
ncbi:MAG: hypothetical protein ACK56I_29050, partial [bacterium]